MTPRPIPARGETTPDTRPVRDGLDDSPILPFPPGFDPATRLPVEPAGTPELPTLRSLWGKYPGLERADDDAELLAQIAALTSEVSALREAVDEYLSAEDGLRWTGRISMAEWDARIARHKDARSQLALRAARRDGAP